MNDKPISISGISESRIAPIVAEIAKSHSGRALLLVSSETRARRLAEDLAFLWIFRSTPCLRKILFS